MPINSSEMRGLDCCIPTFNFFISQQILAAFQTQILYAFVERLYYNFGETQERTFTYRKNRVKQPGKYKHLTTVKVACAGA